MAGTACKFYSSALTFKGGRGDPFAKRKMKGVSHSTASSLTLVHVPFSKNTPRPAPIMFLVYLCLRFIRRKKKARYRFIYWRFLNKIRSCTVLSCDGAVSVLLFLGGIGFVCWEFIPLSGSVSEARAWLWTIIQKFIIYQVNSVRAASGADVLKK